MARLFGTTISKRTSIDSREVIEWLLCTQNRMTLSAPMEKNSSYAFEDDEIKQLAAYVRSFCNK